MQHKFIYHNVSCGQTKHTFPGILYLRHLVQKNLTLSPHLHLKKESE